MKDELIKALNELKVIQFSDDDIQKRIDKMKSGILDNKLEFLKSTTPKMYLTADIKNIDKRIVESKKTFVWITGAWGCGKTYSLYAIRNNKILNNNFYFEIKNENELNYDLKISRINAIDNITVNENKIKYLCQFYFDLIDYHYVNKKRLYISSTLNYNVWLNELNRLSAENAGAIASRFSNNIELIELKGDDRRKQFI